MARIVTQTIRVLPGEPDDQLIMPAALALRRGQLVAFPTETVYGLGANALDPAAVAAIFTAKGRPADNPLIVHIASVGDLAPLVSVVPPLAVKLLNAFSPGPLTLVLPKSAIVPDLVTAGLATVAVRIPAHPVARRLIELAGVPVAAPSANRSGRPSPTQSWHVEEDLSGRIPFIIDAGSCDVGLESTVVDVTGSEPVILRPGAVTAAEIRAIAGSVIEAGRSAAGDQTPRSPGMKYRHYAPKATVLIAEGASVRQRAAHASQLAKTMQERGLPAGFLGCRPFLDLLRLPDQSIRISTGEQPDAHSASQILFDALRRLDQAGVSVIIAESLPNQGMGRAYMNRLSKAASAHTLKQVIFACTGNTCRSPMAEALFNLYNTDPGWTAASCGLAASGGEPASTNAIKVMIDDYQIDISKHRSQRANRECLNPADLVLTMTTAQRDHLRQHYPDLADKILSLGEYAGEPWLSIPDPFGRDQEAYKMTAAALARIIKKIVAKISKTSDPDERQDDNHPV